MQVLNFTASALCLSYAQNFSFCRLMIINVMLRKMGVFNISDKLAVQAELT